MRSNHLCETRVALSRQCWFQEPHCQANASYTPRSGTSPVARVDWFVNMHTCLYLAVVVVDDVCKESNVLAVLGEVGQGRVERVSVVVNGEPPVGGDVGPNERINKQQPG